MTVVSRARRRESRRVFFLSVGGFLSTFLPPALLLLLRWEDYTRVPAGGVRLTVGGLLLAGLLLCRVLGRMPHLSRVTVLALALTLVYLLEGILSELPLILWVTLAGEAVDALVFSPLLKRARERRAMLAQSEMTADAVRAAIGNAEGR